MNLRPARTAIAVLLTSTLLLAGCSDDGDGEKSGSKPSDGSSSDTGASEATSGATSGDGAATDGGGTGSSDLDKDTFFETVIRAQQGAGSFRSKSTTSAAGATTELDSEAIYEDGGFRGHAKSTAASPQQIETVIADGVIYLKGDGLGVPAGKWLKFDPKDPENADNPLAGIATAADPEVALRAMGKLDALELVGTETVNGVKARHYKAVMVTSNYVKELGLPAEVAGILPPKLPFDMWVDEENRPVKFSIEFDIQGMTSKSVQTYSDYGVDLDITTPKDADTVKYSELGKG